MKAKEANKGWLAEEPLCWVLAMLLMGVNCGGLFGFNGVRAALDGHPIGALVVMGAGAALGCWCVWSSLCELWRRWRNKK